MPIYEYQCESCGQVRDIRHGFRETTQERCEACDGPLKRIFNPAGIVFKGSGFYVTDSRKNSGKESSSSESGKSDGAKSDGGKSDGAKSDGAKADSAPASPSKGDSGPKSTTAA